MLENSLRCSLPLFFLTSASLMLTVVTAQATLITTADGAGADAFVTRTQGSTNFGASETLPVKYDIVSTVDLHRKSYLKFDLSLHEGPIQSASLELVFASTSVSSPISATVGVFGLEDGHAGEDWDELALTWNNAPANNQSGNTMGSGATALGSFSLDLTLLEPGAVVSFTSPELIDWLASDTNGLATIVLVRVAPRSRSNQSFASKESLTLGAPRLAIVPEPTAALMLGLGLVGIAVRQRIG